MQVARDEIGAPRIDLLHQIEALHVGLQRAGQRNGAGIVDADIDAAESCDGLSDRIDDLLLKSDIADDRQRLAARLLDLVGGRIDRAGQFRIGFGRLGGNGDIRAVFCGAQRNREPDAAARAGDEQRLAGEDSWASPSDRLVPIDAVGIRSCVRRVPRARRQFRWARLSPVAMPKLPLVILARNSAGNTSTARFGVGAQREQLFDAAFMAVDQLLQTQRRAAERLVVRRQHQHVCREACRVSLAQESSQSCSGLASGSVGNRLTFDEISAAGSDRPR